MTTGTRVAWGRVGLYYAIAFGMVAALSVVLWALGANMATEGVQMVFQLTVAFLYMPMPLVAGLIVERVAGRPALIRRTWSEFKGGWLRVIGYSTLAALGLYAANFSVTWLLGNVMGLEGFGRLALTQQQVIEAIGSIQPGTDVSSLTSTLPPTGAMYLIGAVAGLAAGFTINGLFAFGEEYGWRGVLMDELAPLGPVKANLLTGVMWGLWHAPIILLGFNYGDDRLLGILMMCVWVTPLSFLLWRSREYSGSVVAPAIIHGAFNGSAGFFLFLLLDRESLLAAPVGVMGAVAAALVAGVAWAVTARSVKPMPQVGDARAENA